MTSTTQYAYRAARNDGAFELGIVEAESRAAAARLLMARGLFPVDIRLDVHGGRGRTRVSADELALGLRLLAEFLGAGLPLSRALAAFAEVAPAGWRVALEVTREGIREGRSLASALDQAPLAVPDIVVAIIRAGEGGGALADAVGRAAELAESQAETRAAVRAALTYPAVLATAGLGSLVLLVGVVLPRFAGVLIESGSSLPAATRLILAASELVREAALPMALGVIAAVAWHQRWIRTDAGRRRWHAALLKLPVVGAIGRSGATARVAAAMAALLDSGVSAGHALFHAAGTAGNGAMEAALLRARESVLGGHAIAGALRAEGVLTPTAVRLVRSGEETGRLAAMLRHAARIEGDRADRAVRDAVRLLEPALILSFGAVVALVAAALLQAVYGVRVTG